jgi:hypothetical protein
MVGAIAGARLFPLDVAIPARVERGLGIDRRWSRVQRNAILRMSHCQIQRRSLRFEIATSRSASVTPRPTVPIRAPRKDMEEWRGSLIQGSSCEKSRHGRFECARNVIHARRGNLGTGRQKLFDQGGCCVDWALWPKERHRCSGSRYRGSSLCRCVSRLPRRSLQAVRHGLPSQFALLAKT